MTSIARTNRIPEKEFEKQYKNHLSDYQSWDQKEHAEDWVLFPENLSENLSIDEVVVSQGELYTVLTNKQACGGKGSLVATVKGTKAETIANVLAKISKEQRDTVKEVTLDFSPSLGLAVNAVFRNAYQVTDRFHVQQLVSEALQEMRIKERWEAIKEENEAVKTAKQQGTTYRPITYANGDTKKQLLSRSRYLLFKPENKWTESQQERAVIIFHAFPELEHAYHLSMLFRSFYEHSHNKKQAKDRLEEWYQKVEEKGYDSFATAKEYIKTREETILNYFLRRSTNASAESFNAKLKGFRALVRGVRDKCFFLFRVTRLYA